jgi:mRNA interferase RelE/StbE
MEIELTRKFKKQTDACKHPRIRKKVAEVIDAVIKAESLSGIKNIKKLKGSEKSYRIRVSDYRIGIVLINEKCVFAAFDHRSDIYRYFP